MTAIALHTLVGTALLGVPIVVLYGLLILSHKPPPRLRDYRQRIDRAGPSTQRLFRYAGWVVLLVATLAGLNLAFGFHPLGIDYRWPRTYVRAIIPFVVIDFLGHCLNQKLSHARELYSAVSDDWLLWDNPPDEKAKASP